MTPEEAVQDLLLRVMDRLRDWKIGEIRVRMHPETWRDLVRSTASRTTVSFGGSDMGMLVGPSPGGLGAGWQVLRWPIQQDPDCPRWVEPAADWHLTPTERAREQSLEALAYAGGAPPAKPLYAEIVLQV